MSAPPSLLPAPSSADYHRSPRSRQRAACYVRRSRWTSSVRFNLHVLCAGVDAEGSRGTGSTRITIASRGRLSGDPGAAHRGCRDGGETDAGQSAAWSSTGARKPRGRRETDQSDAPSRTRDADVLLVPASAWRNPGRGARLYRGYIFLARNAVNSSQEPVSRLKQYAGHSRHRSSARWSTARTRQQLWTCPGHNGGSSTQARSAASCRDLGRAVFRDDLRQLCCCWAIFLVHEGPACCRAQGRRRSSAPRRPYFVLNGTSSSNKIVLSALGGRGASCCSTANHKAAHHGALFIAGGIPIYLETDRNAHGLIGPIFHEAFDEAAIRAKIRCRSVGRRQGKVAAPRGIPGRRDRACNLRRADYASLMS